MPTFNKENTKWQLGDGVFNIGQDWTLSDFHIGKADSFCLYTIVKTWHMDFKAFEGCLILLRKKT